jgi:2-dehydro-3-deoxyphosphogluconate aldolase/(4S)-4-hydroxy-2-oxoglutarate aldolase
MKIPVTPGVSSPTQIEEALEMGLDIVKFFPAENSGGVGALKAFAGPYGGRISFIPTGGVNERNVSSYLACSNVHAVGGSWMVPGKLLESGDFAGIEKLCREARYLALGFSLLHIGINPHGDDAPIEEAKLLSSLLGFPLNEGSTSAFVGKSFEIMKVAGRDERGHIAIEATSVERALEWFSGFGIKPVEETIKTAGGHISFAYIDRPLMGFSIHINRRP